MDENELKQQLAEIRAKLDELDQRTLSLVDFGLTNQVNQLEQRVMALEDWRKKG